MAKKVKKPAPKKKIVAKKKMAPKKVAKKVAKKVSPIPTDVAQLTPYFSVKDARAAIEFYKDVFGAKVQSQMDGPDGKIAHAALKIGNAQLFLADWSPEMAAGQSSGVMLYVKDTDAVFAKALSKGGKQLMPVADMFWGDRWCSFEDPFGNVWQVATHLEDVKPAEMKRRMAAMAAPQTDTTEEVSHPPPMSEMATPQYMARA